MMFLNVVVIFVKIFKFLYVNILELIFIQNIEICVYDKYLGVNGYKGLRILYFYLR